MKTLIIDRFEGNFAVCEMDENSFVNIPIKALPNGAQEGSVINISIDHSETEKRKNDIDSLMNKLFKD